jgi:DnaK suppressor protein
MWERNKMSLDTSLNFEPYEPKKNEEYMSEAQQEHFKKILLVWQELLRKKIDAVKNQIKGEAENFSDPVDRATQEEELSLELREQDRERKLVRKIEESLDALKQNEYGYCESCGAEIGLRRLEARPTATQCIDCKTLDEIKEKQLYN